jgi:hypothetical protein
MVFASFSLSCLWKTCTFVQGVSASRVSDTQLSGVSVSPPSWLIPPATGLQEPFFHALRALVALVLQVVQATQVCSNPSFA